MLYILVYKHWHVDILLVIIQSLWPLISKRKVELEDRVFLRVLPPLKSSTLEPTGSSVFPVSLVVSRRTQRMRSPVVLPLLIGVVSRSDC